MGYNIRHGTKVIKGIVTCPLPECEGGLVRSDAEHTLVGYGGGPENDGNHWSRSLTCETCWAVFTEHWVPKSGAYWVVKERHIVHGEAGCCERTYSHDCSECGGKVKHSVALSDKGVFCYRFTPDGSIPCQPMFWQCTECGRKTPDEKWGEEFMK
jgi:hypothetical protein